MDPGAPSTVVQGLVGGTYVFQLSVFDNLGGIGTDTTVITVNGSSVKTITLQPNNNPNDFSLVEIGGVDKSGVSLNAIGAWSWTYNEASYTLRQIVKFDLSTIPSSATTQPFLDLDVEVTAQVASMVNQNINYGFLLKLQTEVIYASRQFVGSHYSTYPAIFFMVSGDIEPPALGFLVFCALNWHNHFSQE